MYSFNKTVFKIHSWLGLFNGVWLLLFGITGSLLVYTSELDRWINSDTLSVQPQQQQLPVDSLYKIVRAKYPAAMGTTITDFPKDKTGCISFRIYVEDSTRPWGRWDEMFYMDLNPYNGKILREGDYSSMSPSLLQWSSVFHWNLQMGNIGVLIVTIAGILLFINIITGIIIYRKYFLRALIFRAPVQWKNWRTGTSGLHRYIGVWSIVFNILIFYSGLQMTWISLTPDYYNKPAPLEYNNATYASIDKMIDTVQKIYPGFEVKYFYIPFSKSIVDGVNLGAASEMGWIPGTASIIPLSNSHVDFDVNTGKIVANVNANDEIKDKNLWEKFNYIAFSFHAGTFAGTFSRILYVMVGLAPALLSLSGFMLWIRRKKIFAKNKIVKQ